MNSQNQHVLQDSRESTTGDPRTMRAVKIHRYGDPSELAHGEIPRPTPGPRQVLIQVAAAGINPIDYRIRRGSLRWLLPARFPLVPGFDVAGTLVELGDDVHREEWRIGDAVMSFLDDRHGGGYAQYAVASVDVLARKPDNLSPAEAAATPLAASTALQSLRDLGHLASGQHVLINGASGGVGTFATQLAKVFGAHVTGVCSGRNLDFVRELGADEVIDYTRQDFTLLDRRYDLVFDAVAKSSYRKSRRVLKRRGSYITTVPSPGSLFFQFLSWFHGPRCRHVLARPRREDLKWIAELLEQGRLRPIVQEIFPLEQAADAHRLLEAGHVRGKLVLSVDRST